MGRELVEIKTAGNGWRAGDARTKLGFNLNGPGGFPMHPLLHFHMLCASRGDGLLPEFVNLLQRPPATVETTLDFAALVRDRRDYHDDTGFPVRRRLPTP
jgi:hypothetical protein